jgi:hypothetical protein
MTQAEWDELDMLRRAISFSPASVVPESQERFTELLVKSWSYVDQGGLVPVEKVSTK